MSIERRTFYSYFCVCDMCEIEISGGTSFQDAVAARKKNNWKSHKEPSGNWIDLCPECQEAMKEVKRHGKQ